LRRSVSHPPMQTILATLPCQHSQTTVRTIPVLRRMRFVSPPLTACLFVHTEGPYPKPSISVSPGGVIPVGGNVTIRCRNQHLGMKFLLYKAGVGNYLTYTDPAGSEAEFPITSARREQSGNYTCRYSHRTGPAAYSEPSDPVQIIVAGEGPSPAAPAPHPARSRGGADVTIRCQGQREDMSPHQCGDCAGVCLTACPLLNAELSYPKPSISLRPSGGVAPGGAVTIRCRGSHQNVRFHLYKDGNPNALQDMEPAGDVTEFPIHSVSWRDAGSYSCYYHKKSNRFIWSHPSDPVELVVAEESYPKPSISVSPGGVIPMGGNVTIRYRHQCLGMRFLLYKAGDGNYPNYTDPAGSEAEFPITSARREHGGSYTCRYSNRTDPAAYSEPSDPVQIIVAGEGPSPACQLPAPCPARPQGSSVTSGTQRGTAAVLPRAGTSGAICPSHRRDPHKSFRWVFGSRSFSAAEHTWSEDPELLPLRVFGGNSAAGPSLAPGPAAEVPQRPRAEGPLMPETPGPLNPLGSPAQQVVAEGERVKKKRRAASPIGRGEESTEITTPNMSPRRIRDGLRRIARENRNREDLQPEGAGDRPENHTVTRKRQVYVIGDSLLRRIDWPVTRADPENRRVCCLPGAKIRDVDLRLKRILTGAGKNPMIVLHVGTNDTARFWLERIKGDYARLGKTLKEIEAQVIFSGILPVPREGQQRCDKIMTINKWLRQWCYKEGFGMYGHWEAFMDRGLFSWDELHLSNEGNRLLGWRLAQLIKRPLN
uniref:Ig-like domain-containing protein n=1 Tax=Chrysemys picta bellii TaxID=8478 RepID=A0A8C3P9C4_CHRPI